MSLAVWLARTVENMYHPVLVVGGRIDFGFGPNKKVAGGGVEGAERKATRSSI